MLSNTPLTDYEQFYKLPETIRQFLTSTQTIDKLTAIFDLHKLNRQQAYKATLINGLIIMKILSASELPQIFVREIGLDGQTATALSQTLLRDMITPALRLYPAGLNQPANANPQNFIANINKQTPPPATNQPPRPNIYPPIRPISPEIKPQTPPQPTQNQTNAPPKPNPPATPPKFI